jgi:hypothetical protein
VPEAAQMRERGKRRIFGDLAASEMAQALDRMVPTELSNIE